MFRLSALRFDNGLPDLPVLLIEPHRNRHGIWRIKFCDKRSQSAARPASRAEIPGTFPAGKGLNTKSVMSGAILYEIGPPNRAGRCYFFLPDPNVGCQPAAVPFWLGAAAIVLTLSFFGFLVSRLLLAMPSSLG
jgi:hypothetical protein